MVVVELVYLEQEERPVPMNCNPMQQLGFVDGANVLIAASQPKSKSKIILNPRKKSKKKIRII